jgi:hypothetical protein
MIQSIFLAIPAVALALLIWFDTEAFIEYMNAFGLGNIMKTKQYKDMEYPGSYQDFLLEYYPCFGTRLISCPICMSVWFAILCCTWFSILSMPLVSFSGLLLYKLSRKVILS